MIFDDSITRASHGWANPNEAATFLATILPFVWAGLVAASGIRRKLFRRLCAGGLLATEGGLYLLLAQTASRGGALAVVAAGLFFLFVVHRAGVLSARTLLGQTAVRAGIFVVALVLLGAAYRFTPEALLGDRSAEIRLDLWKAGLRLLYLEPLGGWGPGQSGLQYMHWFQEPDDPKRVAGMIQSYLHLGVERGLPALWLFSSALFFGPLLAWRAARNVRGTGERVRPAVFAGAGAAGAAWITGNAFSTQWIIGGLWLIPSVAVALLLLAGLVRAPRVSVVPALLGSALAGALLGAGSYFAGALVTHEPGVYLAQGWVRLQPAVPAKGPDLLALPDRDVLGRDYGRELRRLLAQTPPRALVAPPDPADPMPREPFLHVLATGLHANNAMREGVKSLLIVHPTVRPDPKAADNLPPDARVTLFLPDLDVGGYGDLWRSLARQRKWAVVSTGWTGLDLRAKWPAVVLPHLE